MPPKTRPAATVSWPQVIGLRQRRHHLVERRPRTELLDVVADLAGLHAQVMSSAELTAWARVDDLGAEDVAAALWADRTLVKTWAMRGTLHLLPAAEFPAWQAALATRRGHEKAFWLRNFGITAAELTELLAAIRTALADAVLTREELAARVTELTGSPAQGERLRENWGVFLKPAAGLGLLVFGPNQGQKVTFTGPAGWLGGWTDVPEAAGVALVVRRYLAATGPVTRDEFARWWGVQSAPAAERMITALGDEVAPVDLDGQPAWALAADLPELAAAEPVPGVRLLPAFDQYVIAATRHADALLPAPGLRDRIYRPQGWLTPVLAVDGRFAGTWRHDRSGARPTVTVTPFGSAPRATVRRAVAAEVDRLAAQLGGEPTLEWTDPD